MFTAKNKVAQSERRHEARYPVETNVIIFCGSEFVQTRTLNISRSGVLITTPLPTRFLDRKLDLRMASVPEDSQSYSAFQAEAVDSSGLRLKIIDSETEGFL